MDILTNLNHDLFLFLNRYNFPVVDNVMSIITYTGNGLVLIALLLISLAIFDRKRMIRIPITVLLACVLGGVVVHIFKSQIETVRPLIVFPDAHFLGPALKYGSFPSGHTQLVFSAATILAKEYKKSWKFFYLWAFLVGYSRIYMGAHFPLDVAAGAIIGYLSGKFVLWYNYLSQKECQISSKMKEAKECGKE